MKLIGLALLFSLSSIASGEISKVHCTGSAYISELQRNEKLMLSIDTDMRYIEVYDFTSDIWEWVPLIVAKQAPKDDSIEYELIYDGANFPANLPPEDYVLKLEIEDNQRTPKIIKNFHGVLGGLKIPPTQLLCEP